MAVFVLTAEEYSRYRKDLLSQPKKSRLKLFIPYSIVACLFIFSLFFEQYAFAVVILLLLFLFFWSTGGGLKKETLRRYNTSRFLSNEITVEFSDRIYKVRMGLNKLNLAVTDLSLVRALSESYCLIHNSGLELFVPFHALSEEEKEFIEKYRQRFDDNYRGQT